MNILPIAIYTDTTQLFRISNILPIAIYTDTTQLSRISNIPPIAIYTDTTQLFRISNILPIAIYTNTTQLSRTSNFIGPGYHAALLLLRLGSIVLLFVLLFSQPIREDLVIAAYCPHL